MKREFLEGLGLDQEAVDQIMAESGAELDELKRSNGQLAAQLADRDYSDALSRAIAEKGLKFSSKSAEKAFTAALREQKLELKEGRPVGLDEFIRAQREADPEAFAPDRPAPRFTPDGGGRIEPGPDRSSAELIAASIGRARAQRSKTAGSIISNYTGGIFNGT